MIDKFGVYYLIYLVIAFFAIVDLYVGKIKSKKIILIISFILFVFSAIRSDNVGADTSIYLKDYTLINSDDYVITNNFFQGSFEIGYVLLNKVLYCISPEEQTILVGSSFIVIYGITYVYIKYSRDLFMSLLLFVGIGLYMSLMTPIRQSISIVFVLLGVFQLIKNNLGKFLFWICVAGCFHASAFIFILFGAMIKESKSAYIAVIVIYALATTIVYYYGFELFVPYINLGKYSTYLIDYYQGSSTEFGMGILRVFVFILTILVVQFIKYKKRAHLTDKKIREINMLSIVVFCGCFIMLMGYKVTMLARFQDSYIIFYTMIFPMLWNELPKGNKKIILPVVIAITGFYLWMFCVSNGAYFEYSIFSKV